MSEVRLLTTKSPFIMSCTAPPDEYPSTTFKLGPGEKLPAVLLTSPCTDQPTSLCSSSVNDGLPKEYRIYHESLRTIPYIMVCHSVSTVKRILTFTLLGLISYPDNAPVGKYIAGVQGSSGGKVHPSKAAPPYPTNV